MLLVASSPAPWPHRAGGVPRSEDVFLPRCDWSFSILILGWRETHPLRKKISTPVVYDVIFDFCPTRCDCGHNWTCHRTVMTCQEVTAEQHFFDEAAREQAARQQQYQQRPASAQQQRPASAHGGVRFSKPMKDTRLFEKFLKETLGEFGGIGGRAERPKTAPSARYYAPFEQRTCTAGVNKKNSDKSSEVPSSRNSSRVPSRKTSKNSDGAASASDATAPSSTSVPSSSSSTSSTTNRSRPGTAPAGSQYGLGGGGAPAGSAGSGTTTNIPTSSSPAASPVSGGNGVGQRPHDDSFPTTAPTNANKPTKPPGGPRPTRPGSARPYHARRPPSARARENPVVRDRPPSARPASAASRNADHYKRPDFPPWNKWSRHYRQVEERINAMQRIIDNEAPPLSVEGLSPPRKPRVNFGLLGENSERRRSVESTPVSVVAGWSSSSSPEKPVPECSRTTFREAPVVVRGGAPGGNQQGSSSSSSGRGPSSGGTSGVPQQRGGSSHKGGEKPPSGKPSTPVSARRYANGLVAKKAITVSPVNKPGTLNKRVTELVGSGRKADSFQDELVVAADTAMAETTGAMEGAPVWAGAEEDEEETHQPLLVEAAAQTAKTACPADPGTTRSTTTSVAEKRYGPRSLRRPTSRNHGTRPRAQFANDKTDPPPKRHTQSAFHDTVTYGSAGSHDAPFDAHTTDTKDPNQSDFFSTNMGHKRSLQEIMRPESARPRAHLATGPRRAHQDQANPWHKTTAPKESLAAQRARERMREIGGGDLHHELMIDAGGGKKVKDMTLDDALARNLIFTDDMGFGLESNKAFRELSRDREVVSRPGSSGSGRSGSGSARSGRSGPLSGVSTTTLLPHARVSCSSEVDAADVKKQEQYKKLFDDLLSDDGSEVDYIFTEGGTEGGVAQEVRDTGERNASHSTEGNSREGGGVMVVGGKEEAAVVVASVVEEAASVEEATVVEGAATEKNGGETVPLSPETFWKRTLHDSPTQGALDAPVMTPPLPAALTPPSRPAASSPSDLPSGILAYHDSDDEPDSDGERISDEEDVDVVDVLDSTSQSQSFVSQQDERAGAAGSPPALDFEKLCGGVSGAGDLPKQSFRFSEDKDDLIKEVVRDLTANLAQSFEDDLAAAQTSSSRLGGSRRKRNTKHVRSVPAGRSKNAGGEAKKEPRKKGSSGGSWARPPPSAPSSKQTTTSTVSTTEVHAKSRPASAQPQRGPPQRPASARPLSGRPGSGLSARKPVALPVSSIDEQALFHAGTNVSLRSAHKASRTPIWG